MVRRQDLQSKVLYELSALILNIIRSPPMPIQFPDDSPVVYPPPPLLSTSGQPPRLPPITPAGFASLLLGISLALMLCGSVTFFIGFMLMPWVLGLVMVFYVVGIVSSLSMIGRAILCHNTSPATPRKEVPAEKSLTNILAEDTQICLGCSEAYVLKAMQILTHDYWGRSMEAILKHFSGD